MLVWGGVFVWCVGVMFWSGVLVWRVWHVVYFGCGVFGM